MFIKYLFCLLFLCSLLLGKHVFSQKEYNNWYFGDSAGITFNSSIPLPLLNSSMSQFEGCASISDTGGYLLFYTNGVNVYNKFHQLMPNGTGLYGDQSSTQSALIVQKPLCKYLYYVFTVSPSGISVRGLRYSIVDIRNDNGNGDVVIKNIPLKTPVAEKLTAIRHKNGVDIWILVHGMLNNSFYAFLLTTDGIQNTPVISNIGEIFNVDNFIGYLKSNPKGKIIACASWRINHFELFSFDNSNGNLSNSVLIDNSDTVPENIYYYGIEFSPDGNLLYLNRSCDSTIIQYSVKEYNIDSIMSSEMNIGYVNTNNPLFVRIGALQLSPDNKIYIARYNRQFVSVINSPNEHGIACNLIDSAVFLSGKICKYGLPNNPFTAPYIQQDGCFTGTYSFHLTDTTPYQRWDFGDPLQTGDTALQANPSFTYTQPGVYIVSCIYLTDWQTYDTVITTVYAHPVPDLLGTDTLLACNQDSLLILADSAYDRYQWSTGADTSFAWVQQSGKYYITATEACSCAVQDSVIVLIRPKPELGPDTSLCPQESLVLHSDLISSSYTWSNGSTASSIQVNQPGMYWLELSDGNCIRSDSINVDAIEISLDIGKDTILCDGEELEITANGDFETIIWENGSTTLTRIVSQSGWVSAIAAKAHCSNTDSLYIRPCSQIRFPNVFTPNGDQKNDFFAPEFKEISLYKLLIFNRWGQEIYRSNDPQSGWDGRFNTQECQAGTYYYSATYQFTNHNGTKEITQTGSLMLLR
jgi:gliding motility-associated-like protein